MDYSSTQLLKIAVALCLGLLVGLQREWVQGKRIGLRSFALVSTIGCLVGLLSDELGGWVLAAGLLSVTAAVFIHTYIVSRKSDVSGMTTELAAITMFLVGALVGKGQLATAVVTGGILTLLLHWKAPMHEWIRRVGNAEFEAIGRFVLITLVVLPVLPNQNYGPFSVLNPWHIWLMVALIVGINLIGYFSFKVGTGKGGVFFNGVLGGLVSSTATAVSFARRSQASEHLAPFAAGVILIASLLMYGRILLETAVVALELVPHLMMPVATFVALFAVVIAIYLFRLRPTRPDEVEAENPAEIRTALTFGLIYSIVLFASAGVEDYFGESMLYPVAVLSGLTDVDAITLSISRLFVESRIDAEIAWRVIFAASLSNIAFKTGVVVIFGGRRLRRQVAPVMGFLTLVGVVGLLLWP